MFSMLLLVPPAVGLVEGLFMDDDELPRTLVCCTARRHLIFRPALALAHALRSMLAPSCLSSAYRAAHEAAPSAAEEVKNKAESCVILDEQHTNPASSRSVNRHNVSQAPRRHSAPATS